MKITALCGGSYVSGMEVQALALFEGLCRRGHEVHVLTSGWTDGDFPSRLDAAGIPHTPVFLGKLTLSRRPEHLRWTADTIRHLPGALRSVRQHIRSFQPDLVLLFQRDSALLTARLIRHLPCVYHVAELPENSALNRWIYRYLDLFVRRWIAVSDFIASKLPASGIHPDKVHRVYCGDPERAVSNRFSSPNNLTRIGICGQVGDWKGHDDLIAALSLVRQQGIPFQCYIYGKGEEKYVARLQRKIEILNLAGSIRWKGFLHDRAEMYREIDVLVVPSRFEEPFGLVSAEAGLNGIPAVVTRRGGLPEVVEDGITGFLVDAENPDQLADRLERLIRDAPLRQRMGEAARARVAERFTVAQMVEGHEKVFREALA